MSDRWQPGLAKTHKEITDRNERMSEQMQAVMGDLRPEGYAEQLATISNAYALKEGICLQHIELSLRHIASAMEEGVRVLVDIRDSINRLAR